MASHHNRKHQNYFQLDRQSYQPKQQQQLFPPLQINQTTSTPDQQFSSRNSLRLAQFLANKQTATLDTANSRQQRVKSQLANMLASSENYTTIHGAYVPDQDSYEYYDYVPLDSEAFLRPVGGYLYCLLCGIRKRSADEEAIDEHLFSSYHVDCYDKLRSLLVGQIPDEGSLQMSSIRELINKWLRAINPDESTYNARYDIAAELNHMISLINPQCTVRVIGSLACGTMLNTSDINLELLHPNSNLFESDPRAKNSVHHILVDPEADFGNQINYHTLHYDLAPNAFETLHKIGRTIKESHYLPTEKAFQLISNYSDLNRKVPKLVLRHTLTQTIVELCCYAGSEDRLTNLLKLYMNLDGRARILSLIVKHWAQVCCINNPDQGTYSPDTFVILVIYYLQRITPPVLPCIHEWVQASRSNNDREAPPSPTKKPNLDNPSTPQSSRSQTNGANHEQADASLDDTTTEQANEAIEGEPDEEEEEDDKLLLNLDDPEAEIDIDWTSENTDDVAKLFIDFLKFMFLEFSDINNIITIRTLKNIHPSNRGWNASNIKSIEHPIKKRFNISRSIGTQRTFNYIRNCFRYGFYYLSSIPVNRRLNPKDQHEGDPRDYIDFYINASRLEFYFEMKEKSLRSSGRQINTIDEMINQRIFARDIEIIGKLRAAQPDPSHLPTIVANMYQDKLMLPNDPGAVKYCYFCRQNGHIRKKCPKSAPMRLTNKELSVDYTQLDTEAELCSLLLGMYWSSRINPSLAKKHTKIVDDIRNLINKKTNLNCRLQLYGSTVNGMGSLDSDLDICMVLEDNETGKGLDFVPILSAVSQILSDDRRVHDMEAILSARVPILKFKYGVYEIDLSMYNQCALFNSHLLKAYVDIDERTSQLFCVVKRMAKACGIADATKGSLSSYAWALLVIHYLQRLDPPILPILQEIAVGTKPTFGVNGWNVWFDSEHPPMEPSNTMTMTQLFKGFYRYYGTFKFDINVVSIRTSEMLTRFRKNWNDCTMAIEDPFELTYNLASRLDEHMGIYITNSFAYVFKHIVSCQEEYLERRRTPQFLESIFHGYVIPTPPPYRGCRVCYKIGHRVKDCPKILQEKQRRSKAASRNKMP